MSSSRSTLASTLADATEEHLRSALIIVVTGGVVGCSAAKDSRPTSSGAVSQSWLPSRMTRSGVRGSAARARRPAERSAAMMPTWSISAALACPTAYPMDQRWIRGTRARRAAGASSFESRTPVGAERTDSSIRTTPTVTGPASAPRPTSSMPASSR